MKIWYGFGSEHSANLIMIGHFATPEDAQAAALALERLSSIVEDNFEHDRFDTNPMSVFDNQVVRDILSELKIYDLSPEDVENFTRGHIVERQGKQVLVQTEEWDVTGFMKVMVERRARVEVYSGHYYPDESSSDSQRSEV